MNFFLVFFSHYLLDEAAVCAVTMQKHEMSLVVRKPVFGVSDQVPHKPTQTQTQVHPQKMARGLKFRILEEEGLYYPSSENKGADLRLCFRIWLETHCPGILVTPRLFLFYLNKSDPVRILSH